jgi:integrase
MAREVKGTIVERKTADGQTYRALRFTAYRQRRFVALGPVSRAEAERELRHVLADVERGIWQPQARALAPVSTIPSFHQYAEHWWQLHKAGLAPATVTDYRWRLEKHLLTYFGEMRLDEITVDTVERYLAFKLAEPKPMKASSINMTVIMLAAILETAVERDLIARNPAKGKNRRLRVRATRRGYLDTAEQISALLGAAAALDKKATKERQHIERRAMIAVMAFAGLRISEVCALLWRHVDLGGGWLQVAQSKTDAGTRRIEIRGALRDQLLDLRARRYTTPESFVFPSRSGRMLSKDNIRKRVVDGSVAQASEELEAADKQPLPEGITPHSLRRTFASVMYALGEDPGIVMDEMGHTDPGLALRVYRQAMRREGGQKGALQTLLLGAETEVPAQPESTPRTRGPGP